MALLLRLHLPASLEVVGRAAEEEEETPAALVGALSADVLPDPWVELGCWDWVCWPASEEGAAAAEEEAAELATAEEAAELAATEEEAPAAVEELLAAVDDLEESVPATLGRG